MNNKNLNIIDGVVNQDLCIGCGACIYQNECNDFKMDWNQEGFLVPTPIDQTFKVSEKTIKVCPFNPQHEKEVRTENELSDIFLDDAPFHNPNIGRYFNTYAGYSEQFRLTSSSGGIATYILNELFEKKLIHAVITVVEGSNNHYEYRLVRRKEDLLATSKTKYYPVTMADALKELENFDGKVAVIGIGCFIKAIRLLQHYNRDLREKIVFTVGIICGGLKSKFFAEYLASKAGVLKNEFSKPQFRIKDYNSTAGDYSFGCLDGNGDEKCLKMRAVGDMWGTGMFKCNACDFCDDVTTELADISLGDAWLEPFVKDGKGTNVVVTRSALADKLINNGIKSNRLTIETLSLERFLISQQGSFNHRYNALGYRMLKAKNKGAILPIKRHDNDKISFYFKCVQRQRIVVRHKSLNVWIKTKNASAFDAAMQQYLKKLTNMTRIYHYVRALKRRLGL